MIKSRLWPSDKTADSVATGSAPNSIDPAIVIYQNPKTGQRLSPIAMSPDGQEMVAVDPADLKGVPTKRIKWQEWNDEWKYVP